MVRRLTVLTLGVVFALSPSADAQYFGKNKVRYEDFEFRVLKTPHFDIYHYSQAETAVRYAAVLAERWYERLARVFDHQFRERQPLVLYASYTHFAQSTVLPGFVPEGVGGVTEHNRGRVVMPFAASLGETNHILGHELVHAFQRDILREQNRSIALLPLWFLEGMAEFVSAGRVDANTAMWLRDALADNRLPTLEQLDDARYFPYRYGQALWAYLHERFGTTIVGRVLKSKANGGAIGRIVAETGVDAAALSNDWHNAIRSAFRLQKPREVRSGVITRGNGGGRLNVGAALSPAGDEVVFLSERDQYSIDVYLADAATGAIKRRLVETAADPHYESLQFIGSAGSWNRAGDRFALATIHRGQPMLTILEMPSGRPVREILMPELDEVLNPTWSPEGQRVAFSALAGGVSDLYVFNLESGELRRLTSDPFADLQPDWSPDGRHIAFSTDRFSSSLDSLSFGDLRLATIDVAAGTIQELPGVPVGKNINPQWAAGGEDLYFVADAGERSNIYRLHLASGELFRVTDVPTGVSGVTATSPVLSLASAAPRMAFNVYRHGGFELHVRELAPGTLVERETFEPERLAASGESDATTVARQTARPQSFTIQPYKSELKLDRIGQPYLSAGGGATGSFFRAGISLGFGDMLGEHSLRTAFQVGKHVSDLGAQITYVNQRSRWNWAVVGEQIGWRRLSTRNTLSDSPAGPAMTRNEVSVTQIHRGLSGIAIYPFNRAERLELSGGLHTVTYARDVHTRVYSSATGTLLDESHEQSSAGPAVKVAQFGAAFVHDSALLGPVGPVLGQRYRLEVAPSVGDLTFVTAVADYRRYLMPAKPFTLAFRFKHMGRFGADGADARLLPLAYTLRDVARGYSRSSLAPLQLLETTQVSAFNAELRVPILGAFTGKPRYGPLPIELFMFTDNARLWSGAEKSLLRSAGVGARINAGGMIFELAAAHAFDRPRGWRMAFSLGPSF